MTQEEHHNHMLDRLLANKCARYQNRLYRIQRESSEDEISPQWRKDNEQALENFIKWFDEKLNAKPHKFHGASYKLVVIRSDEKLPWGPDNCKLVTRSELAKTRKPLKVTKALKNAVKEYIKEHPDDDMATVARQFKPYSYAAIRKIILPLRYKFYQ